MPPAECLPERSDGASGKIPCKALVPDRIQWGITLYGNGGVQQDAREGVPQSWDSGGGAGN